MRSRTVFAVVAMVVLAAALAWWVRRRRAAAGPGKLTGALPIIASMLNVLNYDMRSPETGRALLTRLQAEVADKGCEGVDYAGIAASVPGANDVTRAELQKHLRSLVDYSCAAGGGGDRVRVVAELQTYEVQAFDEFSGALYATYSSV